jgi:hypothetical protein
VTVEERLSRLERENLLLKRAVLVVGILLISLVLMAQVSPTIAPPVSSAYTVANANGTVVGQFGVVRDGNVQVAFYDPVDGGPGAFRVMGLGPEDGGGAVIELGNRRPGAYR